MTSVLFRRVLSAQVLLACLAILFAPCSPSSVAADDSRYSLGTIQYDEHLEIAAGSRLTTLLAFYNVDGTLPVDLELYVAEASRGLAISLSRPDAEAGSAGTDVLSLRVSPSRLYEESPDCQSAGQRAEYLPTRGYVSAHVAPGRNTSRPGATCALTLSKSWSMRRGLRLFHRTFLSASVLWRRGRGERRLHRTGPFSIRCLSCRHRRHAACPASSSPPW